MYRFIDFHVIALGSSATCNGIPSSDPDCCSSLSPCDDGRGDCDTDSECKDDLKCGINNCHRDFSVNTSNWNWHDDCCAGTSN